MIKIETEKVLPVSGIVSRKIKSISGVLPSDKLPVSYQNYPQQEDTNWLDQKENGLHIWGCPDSVDFEVGQIYSEETFQKGLRSIKKCGQKLHEINKKISALKESWKGDETFVI